MPDPDEGAVTLPNIDIPANASPSEVFASFAQLDPQRFPQHVQKPNFPQPEATPEVKPEPAKEAPKEPELKVPDQFVSTPEKKVDPDDWDTISAQEPQGQLKHENYKRLTSAAKKKIETLQSQLTERETKLQEAEKRGVPEDILKRQEQLEATLAEREAVLERIAVQESPKFKERYLTKETAISERLKRTSTEMGLDNEAIQQALTSTLKRRTELLDNIDMSPSVRGAVDSLMTQFDLLQDDKQQFLSQSREEQARWQAEQQSAVTKQEQERTAYEDRVFAEVGEEMTKNFAPYQKVEGNDAWNSQREAFMAEAKKYFNGQLPLEDLARIVYKGIGVGAIEQINTVLRTKLDAALAENAALKTSQPGANGGMPAPNGKVDDSRMSSEERARATFQRMVGATGSGAYNNSSF